MVTSLQRIFIRIFILSIACLALAPSGAAQLAASAPLADPNDKRFESVTEDWSTPALSASHLKPVLPLILTDDSHPDYTVYLINLQWRWGDPLDVYLIKPHGIKNPPVILNLYGYPVDTDPYRNEIFQKELIKGGFAAVGFVSALTGHRYHDRPMKEWFLSDLQECLGVTSHDTQMILNYLATRGDLDMNRVGMFGQGSGATIAILASAADPRIKVLDVLDPWGDWPEWLKSSPEVPDDERAAYLQPEFLKRVADLDPVLYLSHLKLKALRVQQVMDEPITPLLAKQKIAAAIAKPAQLASYKDERAHLDAWRVSGLSGWIRDQLVPSPGNTAATPFHTAGHP